MNKSSKTLVTVSAIFSMFALAGCSAASPNTAEPAAADYACDAPNSDTMTDIKVVGMPILSNAALFVGVDEGIFDKHGLAPSIEMVASPPAGISALMGGSADFAFTTTVNLLQAVEQGQQIKGVAAFAGIEPGFYEKMQAGEEGYTKGINALLVHADSGIDRPKDLEGKTVSVNDPVFSMMMVKAVIEADGGDPDLVQYVTMPAADSYNALLADKIDAAQSADPFIRGWEDQGLSNLSWLEVEVFHDGPMSFMVSTDDYISKNADTVARFNCAMSEAAAFSNSNPEAIRAATAKAQKISVDSLSDAIVPYFFTETDLEGVKRVESTMEKFGFLKETLDPAKVFAPVALANSASK